MRCKRVHEWISLESDGQLAPDRVPHLEAHLQGCESCREYRADQQLGRRMLRATATGPGEGFEWRLQMRLNNALKESARIAAAPWPGEDAGWRRWFGHLGVSASVGLAAVLAGALFVAPGPRVPLPLAGADDDGLGSRVPIEDRVADAGASIHDASRRAFMAPSRPAGLGSPQRAVSLTGGLGRPSAWSPRPETTVLQIQRLAQENEVLRRRLAAAEYRSQKLQARVDSLAGRP